MDRVLVKLIIPMLGKSYYVWLPTHKRIYSIINLLIKSINELNNNSFPTSNGPLLYDKVTSEPYNINLSIKETAIRNGSELILI